MSTGSELKDKKLSEIPRWSGDLFQILAQVLPEFGMAQLPSGWVRWWAGEGGLLIQMVCQITLRVRSSHARESGNDGHLREINHPIHFLSFQVTQPNYTPQLSCSYSGCKAELQPVGWQWSFPLPGLAHKHPPCSSCSFPLLSGKNGANTQHSRKNHIVKKAKP